MYFCLLNFVNLIISEIKGCTKVIIKVDGDDYYVYIVTMLLRVDGYDYYVNIVTMLL